MLTEHSMPKSNLARVQGVCRCIESKPLQPPWFIVDDVLDFSPVYVY